MNTRLTSRSRVVAAITVIGWTVFSGSATAAAPTNVCAIAGVTKAVASKTFGGPVTPKFVPSDGTNYAWCDAATARGVGAQFWLYSATTGPTMLAEFEGSLPKASKAHVTSLGKGALLLHQPAAPGAAAATVVLFTRGQYYVAIVAENQYSGSSSQLLALAHVIHSKLH